MKRPGSVCAQSCLTLCDPMDRVACQALLSVVFQVGILELVPISSFRGLSELGIKPVSLASPALADGFFTTEPVKDFPLKDLQS